MEITIGRIGSPTIDGVQRILVDRLWPRGVAKVTAPWDVWLKELAPTTELRKWYGHEAVRYQEFRERYWQELIEQPVEPQERIITLAKSHPVMLLTATSHLEASHLPILRDYLLNLGEEA